MKFGEEYFNYCKESNNFDMNGIGDWQKQYMNMLIDVFGEHISKKHKMLDMGCATGVLLEVFRRNDMNNMHGIDASDWYIDASPFNEIKARLSTIVDNKLPYEDDSFYFIHMSQVIEHIPEADIPAVLSELKRVLMPGGIIYISTVGPNDSDNPDCDPTHISLFSREKWNKLFAEAKLWDVCNLYKKRFDDNKMAKSYDWVNFVLSK